MKIGHYYEENMSVFKVWSNKNKTLKIEFPDFGKLFTMQNIGNTYFKYRCDKLPKGTKYQYVLENGESFPDPASKLQESGVHLYSAIDETKNLDKPNNFSGVDLKDAIIYELHIGTFTDRGTIRAAIDKIPYLKNLGINCVELMPITQFSGRRNWGYDGVYPFAICKEYGSIKDLVDFVNECNESGIAVILDVVYNHFGPEGNYLSKYASYFTRRYSTPWGSAISFDGSYSKHVRNYFLENARFWLEDVKVDGFRLDATNEIYDYKDKYILEEIYDLAKDIEKKENRIINVISENPYQYMKSKNSIELDAFWQEDLHNSIRAYFTNEKYIHYEKYGKFEHISNLLTKGYCSEYWKNDYHSQPHRLICSIQTHDQIGNRPNGDRLSKLIDYEQYKLAVFLMFVSPFTPMLFMGEEFFETNPFLYFCDFKDSWVIKGVKSGRKKEHKKRYNSDEFRNPFSKESFDESKLDFSKLDLEKYRNIFEFYKILIHLKKEKLIGTSNRDNIKIKINNLKKLIQIENIDSKTIAIMNFSKKNQEFRTTEDFAIILNRQNNYNLEKFRKNQGVSKSKVFQLKKQSFLLLQK